MITRALTLALLLGLVTGCGSGRAAPAATALAQRFTQDLQRQDFPAACELLSEQVRHSLTDCPRGLRAAGLRPPSGQPTTTVYGQNGIVRWPAEAVFVSRFPTGWKIIAAGCRPRPGQPYDCSVSGG